MHIINVEVANRGPGIPYIVVTNIFYTILLKNLKNLLKLVLKYLWNIQYNNHIQVSCFLFQKQYIFFTSCIIFFFMLGGVPQ